MSLPLESDRQSVALLAVFAFVDARNALDPDGPAVTIGEVREKAYAYKRARRPLPPTRELALAVQRQKRLRLHRKPVAVRSCAPRRSRQRARVRSTLRRRSRGRRSSDPDQPAPLGRRSQAEGAA